MTACDLIFRGATVIDGTGRAGYRADVAVNGDTIVHVGACEGWTAGQTIDLAGLALTPGFIDVHTHDDWALLKTPDMRFKITQGVTSVVAGNCGISAAPFVPTQGLGAPFNVMPGMDEGSFASVAAYATAYAAAQPAVNVRLLTGHSSLRANVMGADLDRAATGAEVEAMANMLDLALQQGAAGLSTGLAYPAAFAATMDEVVTLARVLAAHEGAVYTSHMRNEGDKLIEAVRETIATGQQANVPVVISHHKCSGKANFGKSALTLKIIDAARKDQALAMDVYPYIASSTELIEGFLASADKILVTWSQACPERGGQMLDDIARDWGVDRIEATRRLQPAGAIYFNMDEGDLQRIMKHPAAMIGSDGLPGADKPHPRLWGTFPRVLGRYVRELKLLDLAEAVHKMTGLSAATFGLLDRGEIKPGKKADLVVFDAGQVLDMASFDDSELPSRGIHHVLVNGVFALQNGQQTSGRSGLFLAS